MARKERKASERTGKLPRVTAAEFEMRVSIIHSLLLRKLRRHEIQQYVAERTDWGVAERTIDEYLTRATEQIREHAEQARANAFAEAIADLDELYKRAYAERRWRVCERVRFQKSQLLGLVRNRHEVTGDGGGPILVDRPSVGDLRKQWEKRQREGNEGEKGERGRLDTPGNDGDADV